MGAGFTVALLLLGSIREILGSEAGLEYRLFLRGSVLQYYDTASRWIYNPGTGAGFA